MSEVAIIIPARIQSSRFPRKPLAKLLGREMILHVLDRVTEVASREVTYVATDSLDIARLVEQSGFQVVMTGDHPTGTDRLAEANRIINAPYIINIQGDEPAFNPDDVVKSVEFLKTSGFSAITGFVMQSEIQNSLTQTQLRSLFLVAIGCSTFQGLRFRAQKREMSMISLGKFACMDIHRML